MSETADASGIMARLKGRNILVLEDEPIIAIDIQLEAEEHGASVERVLSADRARALLQEDAEVQGAVLDYTLPARGTADPIARLLMERAIPFVFYSGDLDQHGERIRRFDAPVIAKPAPVRHVLLALAERMGPARAT